MKCRPQTLLVHKLACTLVQSLLVCLCMRLIGFRADLVFFLSKKKKKKKIFLCPFSSLLEKAFHLLVVAFDFASSQTNRAAFKIRPPYVIGIQVASSLNKEK